MSAPSPAGREVKGMLGGGSQNYWEQMGRDGGAAGAWGKEPNRPLLRSLGS